MSIKSFAKKAVSIAVLSFAAVSAHAVIAPNVIDAGLVTPTAPFDIQALIAPGFFWDLYTFSIPTNSSSTYSVLDFPVGTLYKTVFTAGTLVSNADNILSNGDDTLVMPLTMSASGNKLSLVAGPLAAGHYYLSVVGSTTGTAGGLYTGSITVNPPLAPIPEPESYAMLLAGLGVMGAIAVRRNKRKQD